MADNQKWFNELLKRIESDQLIKGDLESDGELFLSSQGLNDNDIEKLSKALAGNKTITTLDVGSNNIGDAAKKTLEQKIAANKERATQKAAEEVGFQANPDPRTADVSASQIAEEKQARKGLLGEGSDNDRSQSPASRA